VRLEFDKDKIIAAFSADSRIRMGAVSCKKIDDLRSIKQIDLEDIPFLKREPFEDEGEYRVIYVDQNKTLERRDYDFSVSAIRRITLSPWMPKALANSVRSTLRSIEGCQHLNISHSQLIDSEQWKKLTAKVRSAKR
jgi:hypothetical protein